MKKTLAIIMTFFILILATMPTDVNAMCIKKQKVISTYLPLYKHWKAEDIKGNKLTDVYIAFGILDENYKLYFPNYYETNLNEIKRLKKIYPKLRVHISLGGYGVTGFSQLCDSDELRQTYINDVINFVKEYNLDGVDVDWEFPVGPGWLPEEQKVWKDKINNTKLMTELRIELDKLGKINNKKYYLSYATNPSEWAITNIEYEKIFKLVDRINFMGYAYEGSWSSKTGHASNLYNYKESTWGVNTDSMMQKFLSYGAPAEKIILGSPNFSQDWYGVKNENNGLGQQFKGTNNLNLGFAELKRNYVNKNGFKRYWDDSAKEPYLYNGDMFISYEDETSISCKIDYIKKQNLGGIMTWEYLQDIDGTLLNVMYQKLK